MKVNLFNTKYKFIFLRTCDVCGRELKDCNEMVCRECKTKAKQTIKKVQEDRDE